MVPYATLRLRLFPHLRWGFANYSINYWLMLLTFALILLSFRDYTHKIFTNPQSQQILFYSEVSFFLNHLSWNSLYLNYTGSSFHSRVRRSTKEGKGNACSGKKISANFVSSLA